MLTNKYSKLYYKITSNAKQRITEGYTELHHIIPQSMGGSNDKENLVDLTAREHFICHWLLIKMTEGKDRSKMLYALNGMKAENRYQQRYHTKITARVYEKYRIEHAKNHSETMKGKTAWNKGRILEGVELEEHRERTRNRKIDPIKQAIGQQKRVAKMIGTKQSEETKLKKSIALKGKSKGPMSEEEKLKRSVKQKGVAKVKTHGANVANAVLGNISINKDNIEKKVKKDTLQSYLDDGWQLGGKKRKIA
jgi:3'-phosphoadenosine 5'-phosphosulfate sulfotransferase (PAPS reductase)/FAD synthetase